MLDQKKVFISGPMTGYKDFNRPAFMEAEEKLKKGGFTVVNPATFGIDNLPNADIARFDLMALLSCNYIYQLEGWENSIGATAEWQAAKWAGIIPVNQVWLDWYVEEKEKRLKDFDEKFEENRKMWQQAAIQMKEEQESKYMSNIAAMQTALYEKGGLNEKEIEKGEYKSARPEN